MSSRCLLAAAAAVAFLAPASAADKPKRVLFVTHSGGFIHDALGTAEDVLKDIGPKNGLEVTGLRYTGDPAKIGDYSARFRERTGKTVEPENCGRINARTLKNFDCVFFYTTGNPVAKDELADLTAWVKGGGAFCGVHCATDTLYDNADYGEMIGAYFGGHPAIQQIKLHVEDPKHPAAKPFADLTPITDEIYVFRKAPYSRDALHIILSAREFRPGDKLARPDADYAVSWCREYGKGKVFYTSLGHRKEVWQDGAYQKHVAAGLKWAMGQVPGDATPTGADK